MDIATLPSVAFEDRLLLPRKPGVYVVSDATGVIYVGQAKSIRDRWRNHHRAVDVVVLESVRIAWVERIEEADRLSLESDLTKLFRPRLNDRRWRKRLTPSFDFPDDDSPMVGASEAIRTLDIPRVSFYRAVKDGRIPFHEERKPWQKRPVKRFRISEVRTALGMDKPDPS